MHFLGSSKNSGEYVILLEVKQQPKGEEMVNHAYKLFGDVLQSLGGHDLKNSDWA